MLRGERSSWGLVPIPTRSKLDRTGPAQSGSFPSRQEANSTGLVRLNPAQSGLRSTALRPPTPRSSFQVSVFKSQVFLLLSVLLLVLGQPAFAASLTWDADLGTAGAQDGSGVWTTGSAGWTGTSGNVNWATGDQATFGSGTNGTYAITVGGPISTAAGNNVLGGLNFLNSTYTLSAASAQTITLEPAAGATGVIRVTGTAVIGNNVTVAKGGAAQTAIVGGGTLEVATGGTFRNSNTNANEVANGSTLRINGGTVTFQTSLVIGQFTGGWGTSGTLIVDAGSLTINTNNLNIGRSNGDVSVGTLNSGTINVVAGNLNFGATATSTSSFNLNGGTLSVRRITDSNTTSTFNFNGGTLKASSSANADFMNGLDFAYVKLGGAIIDTNGQNLTIGQALLDGTGGGGLTKNGGGNLTLSGNNTYAGTTTINSGTLTLGRSGGTIANAAAVTVNGGALNVANSDTVGVVTLTSGEISGTGTLTGSFYDFRSGSVSAALAGSSVGLTKSTGGTVTLSGNNTYTGATTVSEGLLNITGSSASNITVNSGAALGGEGTTTGSLTFGAGNSTLYFDPTTVTGAFTSGTVSTAGAFVFLNPTGAMTTGTAYTVLKQTGGTFSGSPSDVFIAAARGTLAFANTNTELTLTPTGPAALIWTGSGANPTFWDVVTTQNWDNSGPDRFYSGDAVTFNDTASNYIVAVQGASVSPGNIIFNTGTAAYTLSGGAIVGGASLTKDGTNSVTISNSNSYSGGTTINAGTIQLGNGTNATGSVTGAITNNGALVTNYGANSVTVANDISGTGSLTQNGSGVVTLTGSNSYGATIINSGTLQIGSSGTAGTLGTGAVTNNGTLVFNRSDAITVANNIGGSGALTKQGAGILTLAGTNNYSGATTVSTGAILVSLDGQLGSTAGATTVANNATLGLTGSVNYLTLETITLAGPGATGADYFFVGSAAQRGALQSVTGSNTWAGNIVLDNSVYNTRIGVQDGAQLNITGNISELAAGASPLFRPGNTAGSDVTLTGTGSWTGNSRFFSSGGSFKLGNNDVLPVGSVAEVGSSGGFGALIFDMNGFNQTVAGLSQTSGTGSILTNTGATASTLTISGTTSTSYLGIITDGTAGGTVKIVKSGTGVQTFTGINTYTGATEVNNGRLNVNGSLASPSVTVAGGAILAGSGVLSGTTTVTDGGILTAGFNNAGNLTIDTLVFSGSGTVNVAGSAGVPGAALYVSGNLTTAPGNIVVNASNTAGWSVNTSYDLMAWSSIDGSGTSSFVLGTVSNSNANPRQTGASLSVASNILTITINGDVPVWTGGQNKNWTTAIVGGSSNWKLQTSGSATDFVANDAVLFDDTATSNLQVEIAENLSPFKTTFDNSTNNYILSSSNGYGIATGSLVKTGTGTLTITSSNSYTGGTTLNGGTINVNNAAALGASTGNLTFTGLGGTLQLGGTISSSRKYVLNADATIDTNGNDLTSSGVLSGASSLTKSGSGTLTLAAPNTYMGATIINAGTVRAGNASALGSTAQSTTINAGGIFDINSFQLAAESFDLAGGKMINSGTADQIYAVNGYITVSADSRIGGTKRWDVRQGGSSLTVNNGVTLIKEDSNFFGVVARPMDNNGTVQIDAGIFAFHLYNTYAGSGIYVVNPAGELQLGSFNAGTTVTLPNDITSNGGTLSTVDSSGTGGAPCFRERSRWLHRRPPRSGQVHPALSPEISLEMVPSPRQVAPP